MNLNKESNKKKIFILSIVFLICLLCAEYIYVRVRNYTGEKQEYEKVLTVKDINNYPGYSVENDKFKPENEDPQIILGDCGDIVSDVTVNFKEPMETDTNIFIYYSENGNYKQRSACNKQINQGDKSVDFKFGSQDYRYIRLDIDGEFSLDNISLKLKKELVNKGTERNIVIVFIVIDIALLCILAVLNKNTLIEIIKKDRRENKVVLKNDLKKNRLSVEKIFLIWALIGGVIISVLVPSYQTPDEFAHIMMMQDELGLTGYAEDAYNGYFADIEGERIKAKSGERQDYKQYIEKSKEKFSDDLHITIKPSIKIVRHFAANVGFFICLLLNLPVFWCLQIAEFFALLFYVLLGYYAVKLMPVKKELLAVIMLLPMSLQQAGSLNYDATLIPVCCLYIAYVVHLLYSEEKIGWKKLGFILLMLSIIAITKPPYALLVLLLFMLPIKQYNLMIKEVNIAQIAYRFRWVLAGLFCIVVLVGIYLLRYNLNVLEVVASTIKLPKYIVIMLRTLRNTYRFLITSAIGSFGWLDSAVYAWYQILTVGFCLLLTQVNDKKETRFNKKRIIIAIVSFIMVFNLIYIAMEGWTVTVNNWTVENNINAWLECIDRIDIIQGVQGRYFIPIIPIIGMLIPVIKKVRKESARFMINVYTVISILHVALILIKRYWIGAIW